MMLSFVPCQLVNQSLGRVFRQQVLRVSKPTCAFQACQEFGFDGIVSKMMSIEDIGVHQTQGVLLRRSLAWIWCGSSNACACIHPAWTAETTMPKFGKEIGWFSNLRKVRCCIVGELDWKIEALQHEESSLTTFFASTTIQKGSVSIRAWFWIFELDRNAKFRQRQKDTSSRAKFGQGHPMLYFKIILYGTKIKSVPKDHQRRSCWKVILENEAGLPFSLGQRLFIA